MAERPGPRDLELGERALVDEGDALAHGAVLLAHLVEPVGTLEGGLIAPLDAGGREPVGPLPAELRAEHRAPLRQHPVQRAAPPAAAAVVLLPRPVDGIIAGVGLDRAFVKIGLADVVIAEPADVERPQVHAGLAGDDPFGHQAPGAAGRGDARREAAGDEEVVELGRPAEDRLAVGRDRDRPVDQGAHADPLEHRHAFGGQHRELLEAVEVGGQELAREVAGDARLAERHRIGLPAPDRQAADLGLHVDQVVGIAKGRQIARRVRNRLGHQVLMLERCHRNLDPGQGADRAAPHAGGVDHHLGADWAALGHHRGHPAAAHGEAGDPHALADGGAAGAGALGQGLGQAAGVDVAVAGDEGGADHAVPGHQRKQALGFHGRDQVALEAEALGRGRHALDLEPALGRRGDPQAAHPLPVGALSGLRLQGLVEGHALLHQAGEVARAAQLAHQAGGVPGGALGQSALLEDDHVALAEPGQGVGDGAADHPAADDDDLRVAEPCHRVSAPRARGPRWGPLTVALRSRSGKRWHGSGRGG